MKRNWLSSDCLLSLLVGGSALLIAGACGDDGDGASNDARPAPDAANLTVDAALVDAATSDAALADAALADAATSDAGVVSGVVINEILLDQLGSDTDEFAELKGDPNTDYSGLRLLQIDGDQSGATNPGLILTIHQGCTTNADGYCEIQVNANSFQNGTQTLLLVTGSGPFTAVDIDADDDGVVDTQPWIQLLDAVAIFDNIPATGNTDRTYAGSSILIKVKNGEEPAAFGGASRIPDGVDTDQAADWTSNTPGFSNAGVQSGEANNTPGLANTVAP